MRFIPAVSVVQIHLPLPRRRERRSVRADFFYFIKKSALKRSVAPPLSQKAVAAYRLTACKRAVLTPITCFGLFVSIACRVLLLLRPKPSLGSPVRLQARSRRLAVALGFVRVGACGALRRILFRRGQRPRRHVSMTAFEHSAMRSSTPNNKKVSVHYQNS